MKKSMLIKIAIILCILIILFIFRDYINLDTFLGLIETIRENPFAPLIFVCIYALAVTIAIPASAFTLLAGSIFGFWWGLVLTVIASNLGCHLSYWVAKILGKDAIMKLVKKGSFIDSATEKATKNGFIFMMYARLIPLFPFVAVNYLSGILGIKYIHYTIATLLGMLPGTCVYVYLGYSATNIKDNPLGLVVSISVLILFTVVVTIVGKRKSSKENHSDSEK